MRKKNGGKKMDAAIKRPDTPAESLKESLKQMKLMREGKLPKKTWQQYLDEQKNGK